ncbi:MAG: hypothetical protein V2B13_19700 [Pseudomonadota bacterium]
MLTISDSHHIPTNHCLPGHRARRTHTGLFLGAGEARRVRHETIALINRRFRFAWLIRQWAWHEERCQLRKEIH